MLFYADCETTPVRRRDTEDFSTGCRERRILFESAISLCEFLKRETKRKLKKNLRIFFENENRSRVRAWKRAARCRHHDRHGLCFGILRRVISWSSNVVEDATVDVVIAASAWSAACRWIDEKECPLQNGKGEPDAGLAPGGRLVTKGNLALLSSARPLRMRPHS